MHGTGPDAVNGLLANRLHRTYFSGTVLQVYARLFKGIAPPAGDTSTVLTFGSVNGDFATYNGLDLGGGLTLVSAFNASN